MFLLPALLASVAAAEPVSRSLHPAAYTATPGQPIALTIAAASRPQPWDAQRAHWMFVRVAATQQNMDAPPIAPDGSLSITLAQAGTAVVGIDFSPTTIASTPDALRALVARSSSNIDIPAGERSIRLRRVESAKTIIRCGAPDQAAGTTEATSKTGQQVEIRPLFDPAATPPGSDLALRAYIMGSVAAGGRLTATHPASGVTRELRCDSFGIANLPISAAGPWSIELSELRPGIGDDDYILYTATLTFSAPTPPPPAPEKAP